MPKAGMADTSPARARSSPRSLCRVGIRKAALWVKTLADSVANNPITSIDQRRRVLIVPVPATRP